MDDLREFKDALKYWELNIIGSRTNPELAAKLEAFHVMLTNAIENYEKAHAKQNSGLSVEVCSPSEILPIECGFGEKE